MKVFRLSKRVYVCNAVMSLSTLVGRAIKPHDTGEPSSLSQASDHYIDSPTGSARPITEERTLMACRYIMLINVLPAVLTTCNLQV